MSQKFSSQLNKSCFIEACANLLRHPTFTSLHMFMAQPVICPGNNTPIAKIKTNTPIPTMHLMIYGWPH